MEVYKDKSAKSSCVIGSTAFLNRLPIFLIIYFIISSPLYITHVSLFRISLIYCKLFILIGYALVIGQLVPLIKPH